MRNKPPIFYTTLALFLGLGIIAVTIFSFFVHSRTSNLIEATLISQTQENLHQIANNLEQKLISVDNLARAVASETIIEEFILSEIDPRNPFSYREVVSRLDFIAMMGSPFARIDLVSFESNWNISNNAFHRLTTDEANDFRDNMQTNSMFKLRNWHLLKNGDSDYLAIAVPIPLYATYPKGAIQVRIPKHIILNITYRDIANPARDLIIVNRNDELILDSTGLLTNTKLPFITSELTQRSGNITLNLRTRNSVHAYISSFHFDFLYLFSLDEIVFNDMISASMFPSFIIGGAFLIFLLILGFIVAHQLSTPIAQLSKIVTDNNKSDFKKINSGVKKIIDAKETLQETVTIQTGQLMNLFISNLYQGLLNEEEIHEKIKHFSLPYNWNKLIVCTLQVDSTIKNSPESQRSEALIFNISQLLKSSLPTNSHFPTTIIDQQTLSLIIL